MLNPNALPGILHNPGAPKYRDARECDETPVVFCERCREELDADHVIDDGLHFCLGCFEVVIEEEEAS